MDGTLIDTDYANFLSYMRAFEDVMHRKHELQFDSRKRFNREELKEIILNLTDDQYSNIISLKNNYYSKYLPETKKNTYLAGIIRKFYGSNEIVLVTRCREKRAIETLQHHNLLGCFSRLICWEALSECELSNKYLSAFTLLNTNSLECIVYENDINDINSALLAGVPRKNIISVECQD
jgi:beta-phosphoglucomutase-like phosphatase (HAD superfamily)